MDFWLKFGWNMKNWEGGGDFLERKLQKQLNIDWSPEAQKAREKKIEKKFDVGRRQNIWRRPTSNIWRQNALKTHKLA